MKPKLKFLDIIPNGMFGALLHNPTGNNHSTWSFCKDFTGFNSKLKMYNEQPRKKQTGDNKQTNKKHKNNITTYIVLALSKFI